MEENDEADRETVQFEKWPEDRAFEKRRKVAGVFNEESWNGLGDRPN